MEYKSVHLRQSACPVCDKTKSEHANCSLVGQKCVIGFLLMITAVLIVSNVYLHIAYNNLKSNIEQQNEIIEDLFNSKKNCCSKTNSEMKEEHHTALKPRHRKRHLDSESCCSLINQRIARLVVKINRVLDAVWKPTTQLEGAASALAGGGYHLRFTWSDPDDQAGNFGYTRNNNHKCHGIVIKMAGEYAIHVGITVSRRPGTQPGHQYFAIDVRKKPDAFHRDLLLMKGSVSDRNQYGSHGTGPVDTISISGMFKLNIDDEIYVKRSELSPYFELVEEIKASRFTVMMINSDALESI
ncbi:hypothetical protein ScPMuIL_018284 [Solemya velum]